MNILTAIEDILTTALVRCSCSSDLGPLGLGVPRPGSLQDEDPLEALQSEVDCKFRRAQGSGVSLWKELWARFSRFGNPQAHVLSHRSESQHRRTRTA